ncbi:glycyl-radical enzyme activating protein [Eubacteriales bacterium OttesenSCG-928-N13]|nr:glycyl-radical enzyme activating protein [Eubacteriales bacterium OttesenSCG-928-N13]
MDNASCTGIVTDIQRFSVHDGFGIRTSVFLKGCNMRCAWCHNPETISFEPELLLDPAKCIGCGQCDQGCYSGARRLVGREMSAEKVMREVLMDRAYYEGGGGMTLTGGEPSCQSDFARGLMQLARQEGIHTAIETNMSLPVDLLFPVLSLCDLLLCDVKLWDEQAHQKWTGVGNRLIRSNIQAADELNIPIVVRTPLVAGVNDEPEQIGAIAQFAAGLKNLLAYELLPYHALGTAKLIEGASPQQRFEAPDKQRILRLAQAAREARVPVRVAGVALEGV